MADSNDRPQRPILVPPALRDLLQKAANQLSLFDETKHNRAADGKFAPKGGGSGGGASGAKASNDDVVDALSAQRFRHEEEAVAEAPEAKRAFSEARAAADDATRSVADEMTAADDPSAVALDVLDDKQLERLASLISAGMEFALNVGRQQHEPQLQPKRAHIGPLDPNRYADALLAIFDEAERRGIETTFS